MDRKGKGFGKGNRELGGARDLISQYRLWPYYEIFCKKSLPLSISETPYLRNVVGDTNIRKGEGMELSQLCQNTYVSEKKARLHPFELDVLSEAFHMKKGLPSSVPKSEKQKIQKRERVRKEKRKSMEGGAMISSSENSSSNCLYRECLRNHAATLGSYATDGCGEFTLDDPAGSLQCAACGCHRNFHRKVTCPPPSSNMRDLSELTEYSGGGGSGGEGRRKRYRTKFTVEQKEKMLGFAEKLGWKLQRKELEGEIEAFCRSVGVSRQVFKVWMHNHKNSCSSNASASNGNASSLTQ